MEKAVVRTTLKTEEPALRYWLSRPAAERVAAVETLRQRYIAQHFDVEPRLQRVCRITRPERG
ncbi:MAG: hypothetical protein H0W40_16605 [Methylibium sp.]|uniref:hypothetical protein n=1 Tax=Methylibium sp. TaxID=2067992 RepID=UPI0018520177|nr:hypothetical protein [Methylibium sp.]MBA3598976.1 hypothetical protein [Methylibium sp.]